MWRAKPSMKSYWLRWASSAMTTMLRRSESTALRSPCLGRHELLDRREDDATTGDAELGAQVGAVGGKGEVSDGT